MQKALSSTQRLKISILITGILLAVTIATTGGLGGMLYWVAIFPVDVVKSAMQTDSIVKGERQFPTMMETTKVH